MTNQIALILGVGAEDGIGGALCKRAAQDGYHVVAVGRTEEKLQKIVEVINNNNGNASCFIVDLTKEPEIISLFSKIDNMTGKLAFVCYNAGNAFRCETAEMTAAFFEEAWRICCLGGFVSGREAAARLSAHETGTIVFTGATASLRARSPFLAFASAKFGLRAVASGLAREYGPKGVHVSHVIIDGGINGDVIRNKAPERIQSAGENGMLNPSAIAETYWQLHLQDPSAWSFEVDLRPFKEVF